MEEGRVRVLLLEDEPDHSELIRLHLTEEQEIEVECVSSLSEAREILKEKEVDVVVADYVLGEERGTFLLREFGSGDRKIPFIFLTGKGNERVAQEALKLGADDYLTKDEVFADFSLLLGSIKRVVSYRQALSFREKLESELRLHHQLNEEIVRQSPFGIALIDREGNLIFGNPALFSIMGLSPDELVGRSIFSLETMELFGILDDLRQSFTEGRPFEVREAAFITPIADRKLYLSWVGTPLRNERGEVDRVLVFVMDTTKQKQAEERARLLIKRLRAGAKLRRSLLFNLDFPEALLLLGKEVSRVFPHLLSLSFIEGGTGSSCIARYLPKEKKLVLYDSNEVGLRSGRLRFLLDYQRPFLVKKILPQIWSERERNFFGDKAQSLAFLPLEVGGRFFGVLLASFGGEITPEADFGFLKDLALNLSLALERTRLYQELKRSHEQVVMLNQLSKRLNSVLDPKEIVKIAVSELPGILGIRLCSIFLYDPRAKTLRLLGHNHPHLGKNIEIVISAERDSLISKVASQKEPLLVKDVEKELGISNKFKYRSSYYLGVPLVLGDELIGVLNLNDKVNGEEFSEADLGVVTAVAEHLAAALCNALRYRYTLDLSQRDGLTNLYSHRFFQEALAREIARVERYGTKLTLLMGDLDHFKNINDRYGHQVGDLILKGIALILKGDTRLSDTVARYGGEEFAIILPDTNGDQGFAMAERIRKRVEEKVFSTPAGRLTITISFGVAEYKEKMKPSELIELADRALYRAKTSGRNRVELA